MKGGANRLFVEERVMGGFVGDGVVMEQRGTIKIEALGAARGSCLGGVKYDIPGIAIHVRPDISACPSTVSVCWSASLNDDDGVHEISSPIFSIQ